MKARVHHPMLADAGRRSQSKNRSYLRKTNQPQLTQKPCVQLPSPSAIPSVKPPSPTPSASVPRKFRVIRSSHATGSTIDTPTDTHAHTDAITTAPNTKIHSTPLPTHVTLIRPSPLSTSTDSSSSDSQTMSPPSSPSSSPSSAPSSPSSKGRKRILLDRQGLQSKKPKTSPPSSPPLSPSLAPSTAETKEPTPLSLNTDAAPALSSNTVSFLSSLSHLLPTPPTTPSPSLSPSHSPSNKPTSSPSLSPRNHLAEVEINNCSFSSSLTDEYIEQWIEEEEKELKKDLLSSSASSPSSSFSFSGNECSETQDLAWAEDW